MIGGNFVNTFAWGRAYNTTSWPPISYPATQVTSYIGNNLSGSTVTGSSGYNLTASGGPSAVTLAGVSAGKVFDLRGSGDEFIGPSFNFTNATSVSMWVMIPTANQQSNIHCTFATGYAGLASDGFKLDINNWQTNDRRLVVELGNGSSGSGYSTTNQDFVLDQWQLLTWSIDVQARWIQISRNDAIVYTPTVAQQTGLSQNVTMNSKPFYIGSMFGAYQFNGYMNDIRIHTGILTQQQITDMFTATRAGYGV